MTTIRRLAAILAADVAGCSRLMGADEPSVHQIAYKLFDLRGRNPQRGGVLGPILCDQRA